MLRHRASTVTLGLLAVLFSPVLLAVVLFLFAVAVIVLCPETRALRRVSTESGGCTNCQSYTCPALVAFMMFGLPILFVIVGFVYRRLQSRNRSLPNGLTDHH